MVNKRRIIYCRNFMLDLYKNNRGRIIY